jgi:hypothetical protein
MGEIIAFPSQRRAQRPEAHPSAGEANILFFLGVRYVRMDDPPAPESDSSSATGAAANRIKKRKRRA